LIDEARTPLIISGGGGDRADDALYSTALALARQLTPDEDFKIVSDTRSAQLSAAGSEKLADMARPYGGLWVAKRAREQLATQALAALQLYNRDHHYVVTDGKVQIIDEFTGRIAEGRTWQHGLHQLIELKESCELSEEVRTRASITYQRFFRR